MLPTATLPALMTGAKPVETAIPNGPQPAENGKFEAVLAASSTAATTPAATLPELMLDPAAAIVADADLPESGKDLPEAAEPGNAAAPAIAILALLPLPVLADGGAAPLQPALDRPQPPILPPASLVPGQPVPRLAPGKAADAPAQPAPALLPQVPPVAATALPPVTLQRDGPRQAPPPRVAATLRLLAEAASDKPAGTSAPELGLTTAPASSSQSLPFVAVPAAATANAPVTTPAAAQAGHDFAQMIDRLVAARESTQPQAATLALAHAEFGKVELRFASDANGLSVALASADPDFARAVQAAVPPVQASADSSSAQGRQQGQPGGQAHDFTGQQHGQQTARRAPEDRFVAANPAPRKAEGSNLDAGIFA